MSNYKHGYAVKGNHHPLYKKLNSMRVRCEVKSCASYIRYGAVGIKICDEWRDNPAAFVDWGLANGWEEGLQIDRIDSSKGYSPDNCRFATVSENMLSRGMQKSNTSGFRGVSFQTSSQRWHYKAQGVHKGGFKYKHDCVIARDAYIIANNLPNQLNLNKFRRV